MNVVTCACDLGYVSTAMPQWTFSVIGRIEKNILPPLEGPLLCDVPLSSIQTANNSVIAIFESDIGTTKEKRGKQKFP